MKVLLGVFQNVIHVVSKFSRSVYEVVSKNRYQSLLVFDESGVDETEGRTIPKRSGDNLPML